MKVAVVGCAHGELETIYETISYAEKKNDMKVDLILCCGDFQAVRNESDLLCMAVPLKYREMGTFHKYYSGAKQPPALTIFIGGNHEASNYLAELPYGGWVSPNIYYLGYASVVNYGGLRIGGVSGIYKKMDYRKGHYERPPYSQDTIRSAYHVRNLEIFRLLQLKQPLDIMLSHDWPQGIYNYGDRENLIRKKRFFEAEVNTNTLGSPVNEELLFKLQPSYWFSAHLHVKFTAHVQHQSNDSGTTPAKTTRFLALDKCLPNRKFLQIIDIASGGEAPLKLSYDAEWLSVLQATNHLLRVSPRPYNMPSPGLEDKWEFYATEEQMSGVRKVMADNDMTIREEDFTQSGAEGGGPPRAVTNPQTQLLCSRLGLSDPFDLLGQSAGVSSVLPSPGANPDQIDIDSDQDSNPDAPEVTTDDLTFCQGLTPAPARVKLSIPPPKGGSDNNIPLGDGQECGSSQCSESAQQPKNTLSLGDLVVPARNVDKIDLEDSEGDDIGSDQSDSGQEATSGGGLSPEVSDSPQASVQVGISDRDTSGEIKDAEQSICLQDTAVNVNPAAEEVISSPLKKMKRRNYHMYTSADDEVMDD